MVRKRTGEVGLTKITETLHGQTAEIVHTSGNLYPPEQRRRIEHPFSDLSLRRTVIAFASALPWFEVQKS
jgi:hypothetical protein